MYSFNILLKFWAYIVCCKRTSMILHTYRPNRLLSGFSQTEIAPTKEAQKKLDWQQMWQVHLQHGIMVECCPLHRGCQPSWSWLAKSSSRPYPSRMHLVLEVWWSKGSKCLNASKRLKKWENMETLRLLWPGTASTGIFCLWALAAAQIFWWGLWCFHEDWVELRLSCIPVCCLHPLVSYCIFCF